MSQFNEKAVRMAEVPGHMRRAAREIVDACADMDFVIVAVDARAPRATDNPNFRKLLPQLPVLSVALKSDLAPLDSREKGLLYICTKKSNEIAVVHNALKSLLAERVEHRKSSGMAKVKSYGIVIGLPNVGKSSLINFVARAKRADAQNRPGVTKRQQWVKVSAELELWDTPGVLPNRAEQDSDRHIAVLLNLLPYDDVLVEKAFGWLLTRTELDFAKRACEAYSLPPFNDLGDFLSLLSTARGFVSKGKNLDLTRALSLLFKDFNEGKLGKYRLD